MKKLLSVLLGVVLLALCVLFVIRFGGPSLLRAYIQSGMGDCSTVPILCMVPTQKLINPPIDEEFKKGMLLQKFANMDVLIPRGFDAVRETEKRSYFKKFKKNPRIEKIVYLNHQEKGFFIERYPQVTKAGVLDDYEFIRRLSFARLDRINNLNDAFFVIMKGIFTPNVGPSDSLVMAILELGDKKGFLNYNLCPQGHFFECNLINATGGYFKVYIKDTSKKLTLEQALAVISSVREVN